MADRYCSWVGNQAKSGGVFLGGSLGVYMAAGGFNVNLYVLHRVRQELNEETRKTVEVIESIERQSLHKYYAEPHPDMPFIPPNPTLTQKAGYLFLRR